MQWSELNQQAATRLARIAADHVRDLTVAQRDATARLEQARADQEEILEQLEGEQRQAAAQLGQLQSNLDDAERQVAIATDRLEAAKRAEEIGSTPVDGVASGSLCPVPTGRFINDWGFPRGGGTRSHEGTDVFADEGDPIYSPVTGTVDWVSSGGGLSGLGIAIMGDNGWRWVFVHNSANHVVEGQRVTVGQHIGDIGRTGNAATTPPHAHTELRPGPYGTPKTNPYPHLVQLCR